MGKYLKTLFWWNFYYIFIFNKKFVGFINVKKVYFYYNINLFLMDIRRLNISWFIFVNMMKNISERFFLLVIFLYFFPKKIFYNFNFYETSFIPIFLGVILFYYENHKIII